MDSRTLTKADLEKCKSLQDFFKHHSHSSQYVFQLKKCISSECYYCLELPIQLAASTFEKLSYLPLPLFNATKTITYKFFDDLYGDEQHRPSYNLIPSDESKEEDKKNKGLLVKAKVHGTISCDECNKPRCVYYHTRMTTEVFSEVECIRESHLYSCGASFSQKMLQW